MLVNTEDRRGKMRRLIAVCIALARIGRAVGCGGVGSEYVFVDVDASFGGEFVDDVADLLLRSLGSGGSRHDECASRISNWGVEVSVNMNREGDWLIEIVDVVWCSGHATLLEWTRRFAG